MELLHSPHYPTLNFHTSFSFNSTKSIKPNKLASFQSSFSLPHLNSNVIHFNFSLHKSPFSKFTSFSSSSSTSTSITIPFNSSSTSNSTENFHWIVLMDKPLQGVQSKDEFINYCVNTLAKVLKSEKDAQRCIYDVSYDTHFGFCCIADEQTAAGLPGVQSVKPDLKKDHSTGNLQQHSVSNSPNDSLWLFPNGSKNWLVRVEKPSWRVSSKAQIVDYYVTILTKVLGNERDAQMCLYHVSWQSDFGFCCKLDEESAQELATVPGVLTVQPDQNFESENKDNEGVKSSYNASDSTQTTDLSKTKLFITGLSFYTSEKTLRAAFEPFGEVVVVKVIIDKISKRSKGYAFVEYTTEDAATTALQEMNGKIINGWMIVVDRAKTKPRYRKERSRSLSSRD